ncbi:MAG: hypothetical protein WEC84_03180 [Candidatus Andersenbacteria bacterium]
MRQKKFSFQVELFVDNPFLVAVHLRQEVPEHCLGSFGLIGKGWLVEDHTSPQLLHDLASIRGVRFLHVYQNEVHLGIGKAFNRAGDLEKILQRATYVLQFHLTEDLVSTPVIKPGDFTHTARTPSVEIRPSAYGVEDVFP